MLRASITFKFITFHKDLKMITLYEGGIGSGKTYDAVRRIIANLKKGRRVLTNIDGFNNPVNNEVIKHICNLDCFQFAERMVYLTDDDVKHFWDIAQVNDIIVIDECQKYFGSRTWQSKSNQAFTVWASEHRHNGQDLLLIQPSVKMIDGQVRSMAEWVYSYRKMNMFGGLIQKKYIRFAFFSEDNIPVAKKICTYDQTIFNCYCSYFMDEAEEIGIEKGANILKHPVFFAIPILIVVFLYTASNSHLLRDGFFGSSKAEPAKIEETKKQEPGFSAPASAGKQKTPGLDSPIPSKELKKIIGRVNGQFIYMTDQGVTFEKI